MANLSQVMSVVVRLAAKTLVVALVAGLIGAALVRRAPGFGVHEEELDSRLSSASIRVLRQTVPPDGAATFYVQYLKRLLHGDLGESSTLHRPVSQLVADRLPATLTLLAAGLLIGWGLGAGLALVAVLSRSWQLDLLTSFIAGLLVCLPAAALALLAVIVRAPAALVLGAILCPKVFRYLRNLLMKAHSSPCVITARAKGLGSVRVFVYHVIVPAAPQLLALLGTTVVVGFTTTVPVEALCDIPGIGQLAWKAALGRDAVLLVNLSMIVAMVSLAANSVAGLFGRREAA